MWFTRYIALSLVVVLTLVFIALGARNTHFYWGVAVFAPLSILGAWDILQSQHSVLRNYPIVAHLRFVFEGLRPELRQYFFESNLSGAPFNREQRSLVYQRAKNTEDKLPFGTELDIYSREYAWLNHSAAPAPLSKDAFRIDVGGPQCAKPYSASVYNISAMSFGALSANAIRALNKGAKLGNFAHDTGEGGLSRYHRENGGDVIWEIGSGYFGCRNEDGSFNPESFAEQAGIDQVKMVEIKLSQGAKPGHGGVLPGPKVTAEIASARHVPEGVDCVSPSAHSAFSTPIEMMEFIARLRELCGGKPVGFKLCIGHRWEFLAMCKAMLETGIHPDFIVIDGGEGGTGAAPVEFSNHVGTPLRAGLTFAHNALVGANLREHIKIGASGKLVSAFDIIGAMAMGADWCNSARGFMFAVGCIQSRSCHTNRCPVGVTTQDPQRQRALVVPEKAERVHQFHHNTMQALSEIIAAAGLNHPAEILPCHFYVRLGGPATVSADRGGIWLQPGSLLDGSAPEDYQDYWATANADSFRAGG
ncbi:MAG: FMN-binding glutamate synthase family protein [Gammaproteobacteria bacterium]|nr:FMN-binding glutamate synthase family protein [Gammaproteobacteria bacterium]MDX2461568.1 FMN-binding glutamate synthase family protein [Gammaproteobacteria bacterium]